jgi:hypothetical protein
LEALRHTQTTTLANVSTIDPQTIVSAFGRPAPPEVFLDVINTIVWNETDELRSDFEWAGVGRCRCGDRFTVEKVDVRYDGVLCRGNVNSGVKRVNYSELSN